MSKLNFTFSALALLILTLGLASCEPTKKGEYAKGSATIFCDEGFQKILEEEIEVFEYTYEGSSIIPYYVSQTTALDSLLANKTHAAIVTKELTKEQIKYMREKHKRIVRQECIAVDAVALITNKENPLTSISMEEIRDLLTGKISKWNQLAADRDTANVKLVFDNAGSSTVSFMRDKFLEKGAQISDNPNAFAQKSNAQVFDIVKKDKNAIGIISVSWLGDDLEQAKKVPINERMQAYNNQTDTISSQLTTEVNILKVSNPTEENDFSPVAYKPYQAYIFSGEYPLFRKVYMITTADNQTVMHSFYVFLTGFVGQKIISLTGILPYHLHPRVVTLR